ncbi:MAG: homoprotocatechuate degradation operon regulator HpaR [Burkholderiales bacterium]|nr:homoprotocatechuate degradation operon regulator HpaR [Burkholderiales bacterium]
MSTRRTSRSTFRHRNLPLLLLQAREAVISRFRPLLNAHGVTEQQWRIVRSLLDTGPQEPRQIGRLCGISSPSLAGVLARMEDLDLVSRERLAHDQRRVMVSLTARSRALAAALAPRIDAEYAALESCVGAELMRRAYATLDELMGLLGGTPGDVED